MRVDGVEITNVNVPDLTENEIRRYIRAVDRPVRNLTITRMPNGKIQLDYELDNPRFERIRRITGYLVGTIDRWNNAKKSEERERVKHDVRRNSS